MDIMAYFTNLLDKGTIGAYISLGILAVLAGFTALGILFGFSRGAVKATIRLLTIAASAAVAFYAVQFLTAEFESLFTDHSIGGVLNTLAPEY